MELSRSEYPSMLSSLQPTPAVAVLRERLRKAQTINSEIADWLQERRSLEAGYALGLSKLAKKNVPGDHTDLGIFQPAWTRIIQATAQLSAAHLQLAQKIESEVERPLREYAQTNKDWTGLKAFEGNLAGIAKQFDSAEDKSEKLRKKGPRAQASRVAEAAAAVEKVAGDWDSQAPFIFEKFQAVDESRCNNLRDSLTRYHTLEVDQAQKSMQLAEESLSTLLDLNTNDEIRSFVETVTHGRPKIEKQASRAPSTAGAGMPSSTPSIVTDDSVSVQSAGSGSGGGSGSLSHGLGLRRLGTVLRGRNRNSTVPYLRSGSPIRSSEKLPSREGRPPVTPASPRTSEFASSSRNLEVPGSPSAVETGRPTTPKTNGLGASDGLQMLTPTVSVTQEEPQKDEEGYTIPPPVTDIGGVPLEDENAEQHPPQFKLEIKNDVIQEEEEEADAAISKVATHLRMQPTVSRKTRGRRDARDVRNTVFFPPNAGPADSLDLLHNASPPLTPLKVPRPTTGVASSEASDTQSIRSSRSVTSVTAGQIRHPELHDPGLSSSLIETVSVHFAQGVPSRVIVTGEIAFAYNPNDFDSTSQEVVKMENFSVLEKVAPNPAFISPIPEKVGEYSVALGNIHRTAVAFKYQIHVDENTLNDYLPIILSPIWRIEPHQASVIINYKPNPNYHSRTAPGSAPITLRNVVFVTGVGGVIPTSCQSKPVGTFSRDLGRIAWKIGEIVLDDSATGKLLARFAIDASASAGAGGARQVPTEMRWEVTGEDASAAGSALSLSTWIKDETDTATITDVDPFADDEAAKEAELAAEKEGTWKQLSTVRKISSGKYFAA